MAGNPRQETPALEWLERLKAEPFRFGFFSAMRRLETIFRDHPRIGYAARPVDEPVRVGQHVTLGFAPASLQSFGNDGSSSRYRLQTQFFGIFGPNGALPLHLTEFVYERLQRYRDPTLSRFTDLFQHRFATFFYRAWADAQPTVQFDRPEGDRFAAYVGAMLGIGVDSMRRRDAMPDEAKLHFAGHFSAQTRHASGLRSVLKAFFRMPVEIEQFVGEWLEMPADCRLRLGRDRACATLNESAVLGRRMWDRRHTFQIQLGPMSFAQYESLLPGGESIRRLAAIVRNYAGLTLRWNARLVLRRDQIPSLQLGRQGKLGWTSWLKKRNPTHDAADLVLQRGLDAVA